MSKIKQSMEDDIFELYESGNSVSEIADITGYDIEFIKDTVGES